MSTTRAETPSADPVPVEPGADADVATYAGSVQRPRVEEVLQRVASDLSMITDRDFAIGDVTVELGGAPVPCDELVHIAFKLALRRRGRIRRGALLVPLADAISMASYLMMVSDEGVLERRPLTSLDEVLKDSLLEVGNFVAGATEGALRDALGEETEVRTEGCQGLAPRTPPALPGEGTEPMVVGRVRARLHSFPEFSMLLELPVFEG